MVKNQDMTLKAALFMVFLCIIFGGNAVAIKFSLTGLGPFTAAAVRFSMASLALYLWARYKNVPIGLTRKQLGLILVQGCLFSLQLSCFYLGLKRTTASHGALIVNVVPFLVLILAHYFIPGDRITLKKGLGIALGFLGVVQLFFDRPDLNADLHLGDLIMLGAVVAWSVSVIYLKRIIGQFNAIQVTLYPMAMGIPIFFLGGLAWDDPMVFSVTPLVIHALVFQSLVTTAFGFLAWNAMLREFGATAQHSFLFIIPLAGVFFGVMILDEPVTPHLLGSIAFIVSGIIVVNLRKRKPPPLIQIP
ncbi:DMT family transporter [Desulfospira joergensenii]|uniref:DMT family transporter n=1 Tax=Desulfospira joergensenii TaxID=53329 RepID=UPI0003FD2096|nr:DMT family transporter [Desulfospira joergensenii]